MKKPPGVSRAACRFVLQLKRLFVVPRGVVVGLERFDHFEGVNDRENHIFVDVLCVRGHIPCDMRHADAITQPALELGLKAKK